MEKICIKLLHIEINVVTLCISYRIIMSCIMKQIAFYRRWRTIGSSLFSIFPTILIGLFILSLYASCSQDTVSNEKENLYVVNAPSQLILRSEPSKSGQKIISLPDKTKIKVDYVENGWAHVEWEGYEGYVNADYILPLTAETVSHQVSAPVSSEQVAESKSLKKLGFDYLPFLILVLFVASVVWFAQDEDSMIPWILMVFVSVSEIVYLECTSGFMYRFWFLEPSEVGWIWTIVCYGIMLGIVIGQGFLIAAWVRSTSSGWINNLLVWGVGFFAGIFFFMILSNFEKADMVQVLMCLFFVMSLFGLVYYSNRNWTEVWYVALIDMILIPSFICLIISLLSHIIIGIVGLIALLIFSVKTPSGSSKWFYVEDDFGNQIRLRRSKTPHVAYDSYGEMYEYYSDGKWRKS